MVGCAAAGGKELKDKYQDTECRVTLALHLETWSYSVLHLRYMS